MRRLPAEWHAPRFDYSVDWKSDLRRAIASASKVDFEWVSGTGRHIGTVVHDGLKRMAAEGIWTVEQIHGMRPLFSSELRRLGVGVEEIREATREGRASAGEYGLE